MLCFCLLKLPCAWERALHPGFRILVFSHIKIAPEQAQNAAKNCTKWLRKSSPMVPQKVQKSCRNSSEMLSKFYEKLSRKVDKSTPKSAPNRLVLYVEITLKLSVSLVQMPPDFSQNVGEKMTKYSPKSW